MSEPTTESNQPLAYRALVGTALAMISFGQFNDTKELLGGLYGDIKTNFTHQIEYEKLSELSIGRTIGFIEQSLGPPEVIKPSAISPEVQFQYYNINKAVVTILANNGRVVGYIVVPLVESFSPVMPYIEKTLGEQAFDSNKTVDPDFFFDANNLIYFAESQDLGKQYLFLQLVWGFVEYGSLERIVNENALTNESTVNAIRTINAQFVEQDFDALSESVYQFRTNESANFYAYTEADVNLIPEALLTRFEFNTYFGGDQ